MCNTHVQIGRVWFTHFKCQTSQKTSSLEPHSESSSRTRSAKLIYTYILCTISSHIFTSHYWPNRYLLVIYGDLWTEARLAVPIKTSSDNQGIIKWVIVVSSLSYPFILFLGYYEFITQICWMAGWFVYVCERYSVCVCVAMLYLRFVLDLTLCVPASVCAAVTAVASSTMMRPILAD